MEINSSLWPINEAMWDRALRVLVGLPVLALVFVGPKTAWGYAGLVLLVSGLMGHSLVYNLFGISTCKRDRTQPS